jgi:hypothetical protein
VTEPQAGDTRAGHSPDGPWELIGPADCPIMWRRTLIANRFGKVLLHRFMPNASDRDPHDHPSSFLTFVLRGGYDDVQPDGTVDEVRAPTIRFRRAEHAHITRVTSAGAVTVVAMFRKRRSWGFWRDGRWYPWRSYEKKFGLNWRCDE